MAEARDRFEGVLGNETARRLLGRALRTGEVSQAYLFHGPPGVGKRTVAVRFGAALVGGETLRLKTGPCVGYIPT